MTVHPEEYMGNLVDYCMMKINAVIKVKETKQSWSGEDDFIMDKPKLNIEVVFTIGPCSVSIIAIVSIVRMLF